MGRSPCCDTAHTNKGAWTKEEDQRLVDYISRHPKCSWRSLPQAAGLLRCGKSCRLRWTNYLRPDLKRGNFTDEEDELIIQLHRIMGNKWSMIARRLPGRTDNEIKNYWNSHIKRKLISCGLDPQTHRPLDRPFIASAAKRISQLDFRNSGSIVNGVSNFNAVTESIEEGNCSGVTYEEHQHQQLQQQEVGINLELSIGQISSRLSNTAESKLQQLPCRLTVDDQSSVCLCVQLGFQGGELCRCHLDK